MKRFAKQYDFVLRECPSVGASSFACQVCRSSSASNSQALTQIRNSLPQLLVLAPNRLQQMAHGHWRPVFRCKKSRGQSLVLDVASREFVFVGEEAQVD